MLLNVSGMKSLSAAQKDPAKYEWYRVAEGEVFIDTPKAEIELSKNEKFGIKRVGTRIFIIDGSDLSDQYRIEEADVARLMNVSKPFGGSIGGVKVPKGTESKLAPSVKIVEKTAKPSVTKKSQKEETFDFGDEQELDADGLPPLRRSNARLSKRRAWVQKEESAPEPEAPAEPSKEKPTPVSELRAPPVIKLPKIVRPAPMVLAGKMTPDEKKLYRALQVFTHTLERKINSFPPASRLVFEWFHSMVTPPTSLKEEFAVRFPVKTKWPNATSLRLFFEEATRFTSDRTVSNALTRISSDVASLTAFAEAQYQRSVWSSHMRVTAERVENHLLDMKFELQAGKYTRAVPEADSTLVVNLDANPTRTDVKVNVMSSIVEGREVKTSNVLSFDIPVGKVSKSKVANQVTLAEKKVLSKAKK